MKTSSKRAKAMRGVAVVAAAASLGSLIASHSMPAGADPQSATALLGYGSDTTQDVMNALAGYSNGTSYTPIQSSAATGRKQIASWDATPAGSCITPKPGPTFDRPNGSGNGRKALSRAIDGAAWGVSGSPCTPAKAIGGLVDFARSSGGPPSGSTATDLTYLPFARDAVSFAFAAKSGSTAPTVTSLTTNQLQSLYTTTNPLVIGGMNIVACLPQTGSGTRGFWVGTSMGTTDATATTATATCANAAPSVQIEENQSDSLRTRAELFPTNTEVIIPHSAASFIAQSNTRAPSHLSAGVDLGTPDGVAPYTGTGSSLAPSSPFYASSQYGRNVYNVVDTARLAPPAGSNADLKTLFLGPTSAICSSAAQATINLFGFQSLSAIAGALPCGDTTQTGPLN